MVRATRRHRVRHRLERGRSGNRELGREPPPDEAEAGDCVVRPLDAVGIGFGDNDTEVADVRRRLAQRRAVDARHRDRALLAEELAGDRGALGRRHEVGDRRVDAADPLVERQRQQLGGREPEPAKRVRGRTGAGGGLVQPPGQVLGRLLDAGHRDTGQFTGALQHLDRGDGGVERLRELRLRVDRGEAGADHRDAGGSRGGNGGGGRDLHPGRERGEPGVGRRHLAPEPAEAAGAGLANALEFGPDFAAADDGEPDGNALLSHRCLRPAG